jgi:hypothetical protein
LATSPTAYTPGASSTVKSCSTTSRPPRPTGSPVRSASEAAITPPAQITVRVVSTVPSLSTTFSGVISTTPVPRCSRTPLRCRTFAA